MIPKGWEIKRLGKFSELQRGFDLPHSKRIKGNFPVISSSGFSGYHNESKVSAPGVVTGRYGSIGQVFFVEESFWPLNTSLWVKNFHGNYPKYVYYLLSSIDYTKFSSKTGVPGINRNDIHSIPVLTPPLSEQQKIAKILSTWDKAIHTTKRLIENSQQQKKSLMQQLLTGKKRFPAFNNQWNQKRLSELSSIFMGSSPKSQAYNNNGNGLPLLQGNADIKNRKSCPRVYTSEITKECCEGDTLISVRAPVGEVSRAIHHACIGRGLAAIRVKSNAVQEFLYQWLLNFELRWIRFSQGSTFEAVNSNDIRNLDLDIPDLKEQQKIATVLSCADKEVETLQQKLACLQQEKQALMQQLLTGKRRVRIDKPSLAEQPNQAAACS